jgi:transposase
MIIVGCDFHPGWQQVAIFDASTGEVAERKLVHGDGEAERFYRSLPVPALIGVEACGNSQWFLELLEGLGHEVWVGDAAQIRASYVRRQKTDKRDAAHILKLVMEGRFPRGKQVASYVGLIPREYSSGGKQHLGSISKQGNGFLRMLLVEAAQSACRYDEGLRKQYLQRCHRKPKGVAKVAAARKLAIRLYWMLRTQTAYPEIVRIESSPRVPLVGAS